MATLTDPELAKIRNITGALDAVVWTPDIIQAEYDLALVDAPVAADVFPYTYVYVLRMLWGWQRAQQDRNTTHGDRQTRSQISERTKELLDYWEGKAGLFGGEMRVGTLALGLDYTQEDADAELSGDT